MKRVDIYGEAVWRKHALVRHDLFATALVGRVEIAGEGSAIVEFADNSTPYCRPAGGSAIRSVWSWLEKD